MLESLGAVASVFVAIAGLVLYLLKRHDSPAALKKRNAEAAKKDLENFDNALGANDAETVTRMFSELDDSNLPERVSSKDGDSAGRQGDNGTP